MKHIIKMAAPHELGQWFNNQPIENGQRLNCHYEVIDSDVKKLVKENLILEQGGLCCYTGMRINDEGSHIEHFKPRTLCKTEGNHEDVDYNNLLAAYPGDNARRCPYGAHKKDNWYDEGLLISPLRAECEMRFRFTLVGQIAPAQNNDEAAEETIKNLCLDHASLTEMRKQAIETALFRKNQSLSEAQLHRIIKGYCQRDAEQLFRPFCFVIIQAAQELLRKAERKRKSKRYSRQRGRK